MICRESSVIAPPLVHGLRLALLPQRRNRDRVLVVSRSTVQGQPLASEVRESMREMGRGRRRETPLLGATSRRGPCRTHPDSGCSSVAMPRSAIHAMIASTRSQGNWTKSP